MIKMCALSLFQNIKKFTSVATKSRILVVNSIFHNSVRKKYTSFDIKAHVEKDVVLFELENPKFFKTINFFSGIQCIIYSYLGYFLWKYIKTIETNKEKVDAWNEGLLEHKGKVKMLSVIAFMFGWIGFLGTSFYTSRSIRKLILHKGGKHITMIMYSLPGFKNMMTIPLSSVSAAQQRIKAKKFMSLKVKDKYFYYLIDISGKFSNPKLFDYTAGIQRNFS